MAGIRLSDIIIAPLPKAPEQPLEPYVNRVQPGDIVVNLELYADDGPSLDGARMEMDIAPQGSGAVVRSRAAELTRRDARWAIGRARFSLADLPPGLYVARVRLTLDGRAPLVIERPFTI
jgi:hypothetical protein